MSANPLNFEQPIKDAITRVRFAPQSNNLLISSFDSSIRLVDANSGELRLEAQTEAAVLDCCFADESVALSSSSDGSIFRYDLQSGAYDIIGKHEDAATCIEYSPEASKVITAGWDGKVLSWDSRSEKACQAMIDSNLHVESVSLCGTDLLMSSGSSVRKYDLRKSNGAIEAVDLSMGFWIRCVRPMACRKGFAVGSVDGHVTLQSDSNDMGKLHLQYPVLLGFPSLYNRSKTSTRRFHSSTHLRGSRYTFRCIPKSKKGKHHLVTVNDIAFNPSLPGAFVTGDYEGYVIAWDGSSKKRLLELPRYPNSVASLSYNHTGELLAVASSYTYQEANEIEENPQIYIQKLDENRLKSASCGSSCRR